MKNNTEGNKRQEKKLKIKLISFFLLSFLLNIFGLIIGLVWIKFKSDENKKAKYITLLLGIITVTLVTIIGNSPYIQNTTKDKLFSHYPEFQTIEQVLINEYPNYTVRYSSTNRVEYTNFGSSSSKILAVSLSSQNEIPDSSQFDKVGKLTCAILRQKNKVYDQVSITFQKQHTLLGLTYFNSHMTITKKCEQ